MLGVVVAEVPQYTVGDNGRGGGEEQPDAEG